MTHTNSKLFEPSTIGNIQLKNRLSVAPMTRVSANANGNVTQLMSEYYQDFAHGGFGLIVTEGLYTDEFSSQGYRNQPGITTPEQVESWKPLVVALQATGTTVIAQLMHAGALSQYNQYVPQSFGPSSVQPLGLQMPIYYGEGKYPIPQAMTKDDIKNVVAGFVTSALNAKSVGFNGR